MQLSIITEHKSPGRISGLSTAHSITFRFYLKSTQKHWKCDHNEHEFILKYIGIVFYWKHKQLNKNVTWWKSLSLSCKTNATRQLCRMYLELSPVCDLPQHEHFKYPVAVLMRPAQQIVMTERHSNHLIITKGRWSLNLHRAGMSQHINCYECENLARNKACSVTSRPVTLGEQAVNQMIVPAQTDLAPIPHNN